MRWMRFSLWGCALVWASLALAAPAFADEPVPAEPPPADQSCQPFATRNCTPEDLAALPAAPAVSAAASLAGCDAGTPDACPVTSGPGGPTLTFFYGLNQTFGQPGTPQGWVNVLGNAADADGVASLTYRLNGGSAVGLSLGPDNRRLAQAGDFNIDLATASLLNGSNQVVVTAQDTLSNQTVQTVTVQYTAGANWPTTYTLDWDNVTNLQTALQVVDGEWSHSAAGIRPQVLDYDRTLALGGLSTWTDYEATVLITVHAIDTGGFNPISTGPGVGLVARWRGHSDDPVVCAQPKCGWAPLGASGWYDWSANYGTFFINDDKSTLARDVSGRKLELGVPYYWKLRVETLSGGRAVYRFKVWEAGQPEPAAWLLQGLDQTEVASGGLALVAHHVDATFGDLTVTPGPFADTTPPVIGDVRVARRANSVTVLWTTDEAATARVDYGLTAAYTGNVTSSSYGFQRALALTGLTPDTEYHFQITAVDASNQTATTSDLTFRTLASTSGFAAADLTSDDFNRCALGPAPWTYTDPLADTPLSLTGGYSGAARAVLAVPAGTPHPVSAGAIWVPRLMQPVPDKHLALTARFDSALTTPGQAQGFLFEQDGGNLVRVEFRSVVTGTLVYGARVLDNGAEEPRLSVAVPALQNAAPLYLWVEREFGNQWTVYYSTDGQDWTQVGPFYTTIAVSRAGVFAANLASRQAGSDAPAHTALVDYAFNSVAPVNLEDAPGGGPALNAGVVGSGSVTRDPDEATYTCGQAVTVTAVPAPGWSFVNWSGALGGAVNPAQVVMTATQTVTATFAQNYYPLTTAVVGAGAVTRSPDQASYAQGSTVTVTAVPADGWAFAGWSGDLTGTTNPANVTMAAARSVTATFTQTTRTVYLPVVRNGAGGAAAGRLVRAAMAVRRD